MIFKGVKKSFAILPILVRVETVKLVAEKAGNYKTETKLLIGSDQCLSHFFCQARFIGR